MFEAMLDPMFSHAGTGVAHPPVARPAYFLPHGVYVAELERTTIFLDLNADKYQAIDRTLYQTLTPFLAGGHVAVDSSERAQKLLRTLVELGLLTSNPQAGGPVQQIMHATPRRHLLPGAHGPGTLRRTVLLASLLRAAIGSDRMLRRRKLNACVARLRLAKAACHPTTALPAWLPYVLHARFYYPADLVCLRDSFMLMNFLLAHGIAADWVFGVRADPFSAHCWVQVGDLAINDDVERTARFTPILVV
ncbi:MAG: lasso peptide biosynthesis protein [Rhodospirillales bacterium]|nr:lasso peptide biosynthesis protein [Rhodospirillales bacterium]